MGGVYAYCFRFSARDVMYDVIDATRRDWLQQQNTALMALQVCAFSLHCYFILHVRTQLNVTFPREREREREKEKVGTCRMSQ